MRTGIKKQSKKQMILLFSSVLAAGMLLAVPAEAAESGEIEGEPAAVQKVALESFDLDTDETIAGAKYQLEKYIDGSYETMEDLNGFIVSEDAYDLGELEAGTYQLIEQQAPEEYLMSGDPIVFEVTEDKVLLTEERDDAKIVQQDGLWLIRVVHVVGFDFALTATGGPGTFWYTCGGLLLMAAAVGIGLATANHNFSRERTRR